MFCNSNPSQKVQTNKIIQKKVSEYKIEIYLFLQKKRKKRNRRVDWSVCEEIL